MKRRWLLVIGLFLVAGLLAFGVRQVLKQRAKKRREIGYEMTLRSYSAVLKPGATRKDVEDYLRAKNVEFCQMCCVNSKSKFSESVYDDLVRIGQEDAPWYCSDNNVYVAFQFAGPHRSASLGPEAAGSDTLSAVTLFHWLEGCL